MFDWTGKEQRQKSEELVLNPVESTAKFNTTLLPPQSTGRPAMCKSISRLLY